ncbi:hypothetical protein BC477_04145 [Clavibacter michiganensis subsp. michiganensis]|uniref:Uncharacterized protein n=1 Tax=Clavibacter michiganensis subsp. michiganensis TaxID=33013 RepID=A0A251XL23_CLAMM|nr:hypothetical protein BC477_04145 [Clavibacter michiganensis subsp. michiganensis]OUE03903.1 hypothetical protein CMMCAS07_03080 [Clavibacter michiganensis subsp. michiganensis]
MDVSATPRTNIRLRPRSVSSSGPTMSPLTVAPCPRAPTRLPVSAPTTAAATDPRIDVHRRRCMPTPASAARRTKATSVCTVQ